MGNISPKDGLSIAVIEKTERYERYAHVWLDDVPVSPITDWPPPDRSTTAKALDIKTD